MEKVLLHIAAKSTSVGGGYTRRSLQFALRVNHFHVEEVVLVALGLETDWQPLLGATVGL